MKMAHITINTAKLEESIAFYRDVLGLTIERDMRKSAGMNIVFLSGEDSPSIELIENAEQKFSGQGISIGFHVDDVEKKHRELEEKGLRPSSMISPNPNAKFFFIADPNGVMIQII